MPPRLLFSSASVLLAALIGVSLPARAETAQSSAPVTVEKTTPSINAHSFAGAYLAGRVAEGDNNLPIAIDLYRQALAFNPNDQKIKQDLMLLLIADGHFDEATPLAADLKLAPDIDRFAHLVLAINALSNKEFRSARTLLATPQRADMDRLVSSLMHAWASYGAGNPNTARKELEALRGPEWYRLFVTYQSALMADLAGRPLEADRFYRQAYDDKPGGNAAPDTYERIVMAYAAFKTRQGDKDGAIELLTEAETMLSGRKTLTQMREQIEAGKKPDAAIHNALEGAAEILYTLGTAINRSGGESYARLYLQMALPLRPDHDATLFQLGDISAKLRMGEDAILFYGRVPENSPYHHDAEMQLSINLADTDKSREAIEHLEKLIAEDKPDIRSYLVLGSIYAQEKDFASAAKAYESAVELLGAPTREDWSLFYQRGIAYERLKEWDKAEPNFRKALELYPDQPQVLNYLGYSFVEQGKNLDEALNMIRKAAELRPQDGYIVDSLGWAYYKLGRFDEAAVELEKAVKLRPENSTLNDHLGDAYWRQGRLLEATFQWNHALAGDPEPEERIQIEEKLKKGLPEIKDTSETAAQSNEQKTPPTTAPLPEEVKKQ